jgi:hypothetical protein
MLKESRSRDRQQEDEGGSVADRVAANLAENARIADGVLADDAGAGPDEAKPRSRGKTIPRDHGQCGARTRSGKPCRALKVQGRPRCRMHGANAGAPSGNQNSKTHGIYSDALSADDLAVFDRIEIGTLDPEIKIARIRLRRALKEQAKQEADSGCSNPLEIDEISISIGASGKPETSVRRVRRDYSREIRALIRLIADLEVKRRLLIEGPADPDGIAQRIRESLCQIDLANGTAAAGQ